MMKALRWIRDRLKDLFYNSTNDHLDSGRCIAFLSLSTLVCAVGWNMHLRKEINLSELGVGLSAILTALVIYVFKDRQNAAK
jgi:hypothetical protein